MSVSWKLWSGFFATLLLGAILIYQLSVIRELAEANRRLAAISSRVTVVGTEQLYRLDQMSENSAKYRITADRRYAEQFSELFRLVRSGYEDLDTLRLVSEERQHVDRVLRLLARLEPIARTLGRIGAGSDSTSAGPVLAGRGDGWIADLRTETIALTEASRAAMIEEVRQSARDAREAERRAWMIAVVALVFGALTTLTAARSVSSGLRRLSTGTRQVAEGDLDYRFSGAREREFQALESDFNIMVERLSELDRMKKDFLAGISHDLKSPLASIRETLSVLLDEVPGPITERQEKLLRLAGRSGDRLTGMISNLLDLAQLEADVIEYDLREHDLADLVATVVEETETRFEEKQVEVRLEVPPKLEVRCDAGRMSQVVQNLLDNALAVAPEGSGVDIELTSLDESGPARLTVRDRGPGVPDELSERIFERFMRGNGRYSGGAGLGLTICREIVEAHGGRIWTEPRPGGGSCFVVEIPRTRYAEEAVASPAGSPRGGHA